MTDNTTDFPDVQMVRTGEALCASGELLVLHSREAGAKRLRFPRTVAKLTEILRG